jgi:MoxR-like ATPase
MEQVRDKILCQIDEIEKNLYGMRDIIKIFCLSKACDLTILLLGIHATAKSSLARLWSITTGLNYRITTASEVDESLLAYIDPAVFREKNIVQMRRGELMEKNHVIIDEYFLWPNRFRAKLHQLLEEKTYAGLESLVYTWTFLSNPLSEYYSGQIEDINMATTDRIDLFVPVYQAAIVPSETMIRKFSKYGRRERQLDQITTWDDYLKAREEITRVNVPSKVIIWLSLFAHALAGCKQVKEKWNLSRARIKKLCASCNEVNHLCAKVCLSKPRFLRATVILAKGLAWLNGRDTVTLEDVQEAIYYTLPHRLVWVQEELSYEESLQRVPELIQQFNDDMLAWKNRGIFTQLGKVIEASKKIPPVYEEKAGQDLLADVAEIFLLKQFVSETLEAIKQDVCNFYKLEAKNQTFKTLKEVRQFLEQSGLNAYDKEMLLFEITPPNLSLTLPLDLDRLATVLVTFHKQNKVSIDPQKVLLQRLAESPSFDSDLVKLREYNGAVKILFNTEKDKEQFEQLWEGQDV